MFLKQGILHIPTLYNGMNLKESNATISEAYKIKFIVLVCEEHKKGVSKTNGSIFARCL